MNATHLTRINWTEEPTNFLVYKRVRLVYNKINSNKENDMTTSLDQLKQASKRAQEIVNSFTGKLEDAPDRIEELSQLTKADLVALVISLEKAPTATVKVEEIIKVLLEEPACAIFTYEQLAGLVQQILPTAKTSSKSVASYASKKKEDWVITPRQKFQLSQEDLLAIAG